jgi:hypothetical protein
LTDKKLSRKDRLSYGENVPYKHKDYSVMLLTTSGDYVIKLFTDVIYETRVFVFGKLLQLCVGKARSLP